MLRNPNALRAAAALAAATIFAPAASAQDFFEALFGSAPSAAAGSGYTASRDVVSFNPSYAPGQIIVSFTDRRLYHVRARGSAISYPIAVPRPKSRWSGIQRVSQKRVNPDWTPTPEMRRENPNLPPMVAGGHPRNPLGPRALYLGSTLYRIHGTDAPWTIGQNVSKGCVRMHNAHVIELYNSVPVGTKVTTTYQSFRTGPASFNVATTSKPRGPSSAPSFDPFGLLIN
ncbi:MAG: hypothetical protein RLZ98_3657 [Pseudomonadota bacterium]|jgi:lipoprotein-anchoring transpeptidase ErfK/SrfK